MKKAEAISILATSVRPREAKDRARYDKAVKMAIEALESSERTAETAQNVSDSDLIFRKMAIEALRECQTYLFDECDPDKKIELRSAERAIEDLPSAQPEVKEISYTDCANAMLMMWIDKVLTDGEYNRIMDKLNAHELKKMVKNG